MMRNVRRRKFGSMRLAALVAASGCSGYAFSADPPADPVSDAALSEYSFQMGGFVRTWAAMNLQNHPETGGGQGELSMLRGSVELNAEAKTGPFRWTVVGRADREVLTPYEKQLQEQVRTNSPGGPGSSMLGLYDQTQLREYYVDFDVGPPRVHFRVGKQEVAWGETDFFHPTDLINGYDYRWRSFLERDNDELRKPLIM